MTPLKVRWSRSRLANGWGVFWSDSQEKGRENATNYHGAKDTEGVNNQVVPDGRWMRS